MQVLLRFAFAFTLMLVGPLGFAAGLMPTPTLTNVQVQSGVQPHPNGGYRYTYTLTNPITNTGEVWDIKIDITTPEPATQQQSGNGLTLIKGGDPYDFDGQLARARKNPTWGPFLPALVPVGTTVPDKWGSGVSVEGVVSFSSGNDAENILPGTSLGGFELQTLGLPMLRDIEIKPWWIMVVEDHDAVTQAEKEDAGQVEQNIVYKTVTLGPSGYFASPGSFSHWNQVRDDLVRAIALGWFPDAAFATDVSAQLASARQALDQQNFFLVHQRLQPLIDTLASNAGKGKMTDEGYALLYYNLLAINQATGYNAMEPKLQLDPAGATHALGETHAQTVTVIDLANGNRPLTDMALEFRVESGPNANQVYLNATTDSAGKGQASYVGTGEGVDKLVITAYWCGRECSTTQNAQVRWQGGADLIVPFFVPPLLNTVGGKTVLISEGTKNIGNVASPSSTTRYYIYPNQTIDLNAAIYVGERSVPALAPGEMSQAVNQAYTVPANVPQGKHFLAACADAANAVIELKETNNCTYNKLENYRSVIIPLPPPANRPPVCTAAKALVNYVKKDEHKSAKISIAGVVDPDGDVISVQINTATLAGKKTGKKQPVVQGLGSSEIQVSLKEDDDESLIYTLSFAAQDGKGGSCQGSVKAALGEVEHKEDGDSEDDSQSKGKKS